MRTRWEPSWDRAERRSVEGGVVVAKPGQVSQADAVDLLEQVAIESDARMLSRGRTYARAGQVVSVVTEPGRFSARIQGTRSQPYDVALERIRISGSDRVAATCSCPYGCDDEWCKHAAALGYVAAFLLDRDAGVRATWHADPAAAGAPGERAPDDERDEAGEPVDPSVLLALLRPPPDIEAVTALREASEVVPHPRWRPDPAALRPPESS